MSMMTMIVAGVVMYSLLAGSVLVFVHGASKVSGNFEDDNADE